MPHSKEEGSALLMAENLEENDLSSGLLAPSQGNPQPPAPPPITVGRPPGHSLSVNLPWEVAACLPPRTRADFKTPCRQTRAFLVAQLVKNPPAMLQPQFDSWVGKIRWKKTRQPTPVFLPGESHGQRSLAGYSPWGPTTEESDTAEATKHRTADTGAAGTPPHPKPGVDAGSPRGACGCSKCPAGGALAFLKIQFQRVS